MTPPDLIVAFVRPLNSTDVRYMITGSVAATIYGEPRLTQDVDLILQLTADDATRLIAAFPSHEYYVPPIDVVIEEAGRASGGHFNLLHLDSGLRADCYVAGDKALSLWGLAHRRAAEVGADAVWIAPPEYVIIAKLEFVAAGAGERHLTDIAHMLRVSGDRIERAEIDRWVERLKLEDAWRSALERFARLVPPP